MLPAQFQTAEDLDLPLMASNSAIQPLLVGSASKAIELSTALRQAGILVAAIRPPTVPPGTARLRLSLSASHTDAMVESLLSAIQKSGIQNVG